MKTSRLCSWFLIGLIVLFLNYTVLDAVDAEDQKRLQSAAAAVKALAYAMKAVEFIEWMSAVGSVLGPAMLGVSVLIDVIFSFMGVESPEMKLMKKEFKNLNNRLDSFTEKFQEVKRKIEWSTVQLSYADVEASIRAMTVHLNRITNAASPSDRDNARKIFMDSFEMTFALDSEKLHLAMVSGSTFSDNIFMASAKYTNQHPEETADFMRGCVQLLIQSFQIQTTYMNLKFNNTAVVQELSKDSSKMMNKVVEKSKEIYMSMINDYHKQSVSDLKRMALNNLKLTHDQFAELFYKFITEKYIERYWAVVVYDEVSGYEQHAVWSKDGDSFLTTGGRNLFIASVSKDVTPNNARMNAVTSYVPHDYYQYYDPAKNVYDKLLNGNSESGSPLIAFTVIRDTANVARRFSALRMVGINTRIGWCGDPACWGGGYRTFIIFLFI